VATAEVGARPVGKPAGAPASSGQQRQAEPSKGVLDPPRLAPDVVLHGTLDDTAFEQQQFLVERDGAFVQLTPLLYRALEQVDGSRSFDEIAKRMSDKVGRPYDASNAKRLLEKLVPLGLVPDAQGDVAPPPEGFSALRSPLAINLKMALISKETANAIARPFTLFFLPPVVIVAVLATLAAHVWLYAVHGVAQGASQILYNPGLMLAIVAGFVLTAAFHELGHAAGLRYGGGKVRAMGVGLYLVYPIFYTDVTASYALGRWARLRTDLGGFYFNALFQLGLIALYAVTGLEFLLILTFLIDLEVLYQLLPFVRMDGYWILADISGVPDFFTRMGATIRRLFPGAPKQELQPLKPWARVVFALYALIVGPLLAFLIFTAFRSFPTVVATAIDSGGKLLGTAGDAWSKGDGVTAAAQVVQLLFLVLQALGLAMVLLMIMRRALGALWAWARPSTARKGLASLATATTFAALAAFWLPWQPLGDNGTGYAYGAIAKAQPIAPATRGTIGDTVPALAYPRTWPGGAPAAPSVTPADSPSPASTPPSAAPTGVASPTAVPATAAPTAAPTLAPAGATPSSTTTPSPSGTP